MFSRKKPLYRQKRYGLGLLGFKLFLALWFGLIALILQLAELPDQDWVVALLFGGFLVVPILVYSWDERRAARLRRDDRDAAISAIKKSLRNARQLDGSVVDFDPHYPTTRTSSQMVSAVDPRRRLMRLIWPDMVDAQGRPLDETGRASGTIIDVSQRVLPGKRRWLWLLPPRGHDRRILITVTARGEDGKNLSLPFRFETDDAAASGWYHTFTQWMRDDQRASSATASAR